MLRKIILAITISLMIIMQSVMSINAASTNNALTWEQKDDGQGRSFEGIITFNNKLIAVGSNGLIMVSEDGKDFKKAEVNTKAHFIGIVTDGKKAVAATNDGNVFISSDGKTWNVKSVATDKFVSKIRYLNNKFILLGNSFTVLFSDDALKWEDMSKNYQSVKYTIEGITYNPDFKLWVFGSDKALIATKDFVTFDSYTLPKDCFLRDIGYLNGRYIIGSLYGYIYDTVDFKTFNTSEKISGSKFLQNFNKLNIYQNYFLGIGQDGVIVQGTTAKDISKIKNDKSWKDTMKDVITFNHDYYAVTSNGGIYGSSTSSKSWTEILNGNYYDLTVEAVEDKFLAFDRYSVFLSNADFTLKKVADLNGSAICYSIIDGRHQIKGSSTFTARSFDLINWESVTNASNKFIAEDIIEFDKVTYVINNYGSIDYFDNAYKSLVEFRFNQNSLEVFSDKLISVGDFGEGYIINKNKTYEKINVNKETSKKVRYLNGQLIAVNIDGKISTSKDGKNWTTIQVGNKLSLNDIGFGNGLYVLVGQNGTILTSTDLTNWYKNESGLGNNLTSVAFNNGVFVIGGGQNTILASKNLTSSKEKVISKQMNYDSTKIYIYVNNKEVIFDQEPVIQDGTTLAPLRFVFETLGAEVIWDNQTRAAIGKRDGIEVRVPIDSTTAYVDGQAKKLDVPAQIINGRTLVPLRFISESFNLKVTWEDFTRSAYIDETE